MSHRLCKGWGRRTGSLPTSEFASSIISLAHLCRTPADISLFDVGNVDPDGTVTQPGTMRELLLRCNYLFHADSAFNPRRAGISLLLAHHLPPKGTGGATEFADSRAAYDALDPATKDKITDWVVLNSQLQCRRAANPGNPALDGKEFDPMQNRFGYHKLVQTHEPSGRKNLYIAAHAHHVEGMPVEEGHQALLDLLGYVGQERFTFMLEWNDPGDLGRLPSYAGYMGS
jgi:alpha-ketoglutarate-dependent 2,4-dichlorophenoxyacetate dioxygenase